MTDKETELVKQYPEAPLIVAMAESTWAGNRKTAKIEFSLSNSLKAKLLKVQFMLPASKGETIR